MYYLRYYAIGHSYLRHGPFPGWQVDGFWGMAASEPSRDYFHQLQQKLCAQLDCRVEAVAENHATYERRCVLGATKETYTTSPEYLHIKEVLQRFKPNVISVFVGEGNVVAKDEESLTLFYETLYEMIAEYKRDDAVVICTTFRPLCLEICKPIAERYGFVLADVCFLHEKKKYDNPYYAYRAYPEYDEPHARGAIEFRSHPGDLGHEAIAETMLEAAKDAIAERIAQGEFLEEYEYGAYVAPERLGEFSIVREPKDLKIRFYGFNLREEDGCVILGSAPGTGAAVAAEELCLDADGQRFFVELEVRGVQSPTELCVTVQGESGSKTEAFALADEQMHRYELALPALGEPIRAVRVSPAILDCVLAVRAIGFLKN